MALERDSSRRSWREVRFSSKLVITPMYSFIFIEVNILKGAYAVNMYCASHLTKPLSIFRCLSRAQNFTKNHFYYRRETSSYSVCLFEVKHLQLYSPYLDPILRCYSFFPQRKEDTDPTGNCLAGTVVDTDITHPVDHDYYLQSHAGIIGTSRPAHYSVSLFYVN
jgi:hypothetical protein